MKAIMVMFDSLNRHMLPPYNPQTWVHAPNFRRLAQRSTTFETSYVCSMPCMPARRDFHTGRPNFLHTGWGPLEPFDDSVPRMLSQNGVYTHLATDHYHYFEDGGSTYHTRYDSWEFFRGQEGDPFNGEVKDPPKPATINAKGRRSDWVNRQYQRFDQQMSQTHTFEAGMRFLDKNVDQDNWFLQIECFDPHEPFVSDRHYKDHYRDKDEAVDESVLFDWPGYHEVTETPEQVEQAKRNYAALVSRCDKSLGDVMDFMDQNQMWDDTMLIVWTDHGFMLGEHNCWGKNWMPLYEEVSHTPFFIHDPRTPQADGERRSALVQPSIDLGPTLLGLFDIEPTERMLGKDLSPVIEDDTPVREAGIFGYHGNWVNVTDGQHLYMRDSVKADRSPCYRYTLMPNNMRGFVSTDALAQAQLSGPFAFTQGAAVLKIGEGKGKRPREQAQHLLWDVKADPAQTTPLNDEKLEHRMIEQMTTLMAQADAPKEQYERLGVEASES